MTYNHVLSPIQIGSMNLKNRVSFTPVWPSFATADGHANHELFEWTRHIVSGGCACINIGCGAVNRGLPKEVSHLIRMGEESVVNELSMLCDLIHMYQCKAGMELFAINMYGGSFEERDKGATKPTVEIDPTDLSHEQIQEFINDFADAAERAMRCGFDSLVVHGAHGQLPGCFLSKLINERTDEYGTQSMENRSRFTVELLTAIREKVGANMAIEYRINASDMIEGSPSMEEVIEFVKCIEDKIDLLHVSRGMHAIQTLTPYINQPIYYDHGINIEDAAKIKKEISVPVTVVGSVTLEQAEEAIAEGKIDMVSMARGLMADPNMVNNALYGHPEKTRPCIRCNSCIEKTHYHLAPVRCAVNARLGMETLYANIPSSQIKKRIGIIGGGPAGMEAARTAAKKGHEVVLFEKSSVIGGVLRMASLPSFKSDLKKYLDWAVAETKNQEGIEIRLNTQATPESIKEENFDLVMIAVGSKPIIPGFIQGEESVVWVGDVETGKITTGQNVVIVGAGLTGCEAALAQRQLGRDVTLVDMIEAENFGNGGARFNQIALKEMLKKEDILFKGGMKLVSVKDKEAVFEDKAGKVQSIPCDTMILSLGVRADIQLVNDFRESAREVIAIGDCNTRRGTLYNAVHTGHEAASVIA